MKSKVYKKFNFNNLKFQMIKIKNKKKINHKLFLNQRI